MKANLLTTIALLTAFALPALADTFPGADATPCDAAKFTPVYGEDGTTVLYWNNPTCVYAGSGGGAANGPLAVVEAVED